MSLRYCVYKDCHNYFNLSDKIYSKENITFFQFPKDPQRRQKWMQLGKVQPNLAASFYYFCSDHFDKKYKSEHHRRTILVGEAVPCAHESVSTNDQTTEVVSSDEQPSEYYVCTEMVDDLNCATPVDQDLQVESTTMVDDDIIELVRSAIDSDENLLQQHENRLCVTKPVNKCAYKRKTPSSLSSALSSSSYVKISKPSSASNSSILKKNAALLSTVANDTAKCQGSDLPLDFVDRDIEPSFVIDTHNTINHSEEIHFEVMSKEQDIERESLVDCKHATTFIFKGEEYVQMPKNYYIKEKMDLIEKLQKMERVIENIKQLTML